MSRVAPAAGGAGPRYTYQSLSIATNNFEKRLVGGGCGSVFQGVLGSGTRVAVKRLEVGVAAGAGAAGLSMTDQMRTEVEVLSQVQHVNIVPLLGSSKDGMAPCLVYALMEGGYDMFEPAAQSSRYFFCIYPPDQKRGGERTQQVGIRHE